MFDITHAFLENAFGNSSYDRESDPHFNRNLERLIDKIPWLSAAELEEALEEYEGDYLFVCNLYF